jgi:hypothetical protein
MSTFEKISKVEVEMIVMSEMKNDRKKLLASLPADLRERVRSRMLTVEQAQAWVRLREAFDGDTEALRTTLLVAYGAN